MAVDAALVDAALHLFIAFCVLAYFFTEGSRLHAHWRLEAAFWMCLCLVGAVPLARVCGSAQGGLVAACVAAAAAGLYKGRSHRRHLLADFQGLRATDAVGSPEVQGDAEWVTDTASRFVKGDRWCSFQNACYWFSPGLRREMRNDHLRMHSIFRDYTAEELDALISQVNMPAVIEVLDHLTMHVLFVQRAPSLSTASRAAMLFALIKTDCRHRPIRQEQAVRLICATHGKELLLLKILVDAQGDGNTLHKLIYYDISDGALRTEVLQHFRAQVEEIEEDLLNLGGPEFKAEFPGHRTLRVLSDIDDTLLCSGAHWPAGVDTRWPRGAVYPGVLQLYHELEEAGRPPGMLESPTRPTNSIGTDEDFSISPSARAHSAMAKGVAVTMSVFKRMVSPRDADGKDPVANGAGGLSVNEPFQFPSNLVFLSARPHLYSSWTESHFFDNVAGPLMGNGGLRGMPSLLPGTLESGFAAICRRAVGGRKARTEMWRAVGNQKFQTFLEYAALYPECSFIFVGDSGQGDLLAAELMMGAGNANAVDKDVRGGLSVTCCLIHSVQPDECALSSYVGCTIQERRKQWKQNNIFVGRSYPLLALQAHRAGVLSADAVRNIAQAAGRDIRRLCARHKARTSSVRTNGGRRRSMLQNEADKLWDDIQQVLDELADV
eukprot:TRINITY_DN51180_c0_g1_i1.p1 TRINITY_DN51180_c0_g1~~TRINITY_DN51180_c0_g1_i1.p1  ORF type:complete len:663 (+),score=91.93 TRINITY_DN51180_c0_g1_i1:126-2114(+)